MKKVKKRGESKNKRFKKVFLFIAMVSITMCLGMYVLIELVVGPNLEDVTKMKAEIIVSRAINKAMAEQFTEENDVELFKVIKGEDGTMEMVEANSVQINILMTQLSINLQKAFKNMADEYQEIPLGALLGSEILSQTGPDIKVSIVPLSVLSMDFKTEFETKGINQTKYKIYIVMGSRVKVLSPFAAETFEISSTVLVAEAVILGKVPNSFVQVPKEDILDVTQE